MTTITTNDTRNVLPMEANFSVEPHIIEAKFRTLELLLTGAGMWTQCQSHIREEAYRRVQELDALFGPVPAVGGDSFTALRNELDGVRYFTDMDMIGEAMKSASSQAFGARYWWRNKDATEHDVQLLLLRLQQDHQSKVAVQRWGQRFVVEAQFTANAYYNDKLSERRSLYLRNIRHDDFDLVSETAKMEERFTTYLLAHYRHAALQELYA